jgi:Immunity protein 45
MWKLLTQCQDEILYRGSRLRVKNVPNAGEDDLVEFMIFLGHEPGGMSLLRLSGYKSGHFALTFPIESSPPRETGLSTVWLKKNWRNWMPVDGKPHSIWVNITPLSIRNFKQRY